MSRYKVLPLEFPYTVKDEEGENGEPFWWDCVDESRAINPVFGRDGFYYDRLEKRAWIEIGGRAWVERRTDDFLYRLDMLNHRPLMERERLAISLLKQCGSCPAELQDKLYKDDINLHLRGMRVDSLLWRREVIGR